MGCKLLNISLKLLLMLNMCQCLFIISFIFGSTGLYVNENGTVSLRLGLEYFKSNDLSRWSNLSTGFLTVDSLLPFLKNLFIRSWKCFLYSSKAEHMRLILNAWLCAIPFLSGNVRADLACNCFDSQLVFCRGWSGVCCCCRCTLICPEILDFLLRT